MTERIVNKMQIKKVYIPIRELVKGYTNDTTTGRVVGFDGKLDVRPPYQREFVYKDKQRNAVIETVKRHFPLNTIYWAKTGDDTFELLDGQQRTISICQYVNGDFALDYRFFHNLSQQEKDEILDYELDVYQCDGTDAEKLEWFKIINIAGEKLTDQELRNAVYAGTWLGDAKKKFSAPNCAAYRLAKDYMSGTPIRQDYLETAISWIAAREDKNIELYMAEHQHDENANELWQYFQNVIEWVKVTFPNYRKEMKGVAWGPLFDEFGKNYHSASTLEDEVKKLMMDEDVTAKKGIFEYLLSDKKREKCLNIRAFTPNMKREAYERQEGVCPYCLAEGFGAPYEIDQMEADHIIPWHDGGKTEAANCQMLCKEHNRSKGGK